MSRYWTMVIITSFLIAAAYIESCRFDNTSAVRWVGLLLAGGLVGFTQSWFYFAGRNDEKAQAGTTELSLLTCVTTDEKDF